MLVARKFGFHNRQCRLKRFSMFGSRLPLLYALHYVILVLVLPCSVKTDPKTENMSAVNEMAFQALIQGRASLDMNALRAQVANKNLWRADEEFSTFAYTSKYEIFNFCCNSTGKPTLFFLRTTFPCSNR